jgi:hypothetical protein
MAIMMDSDSDERRLRRRRMATMMNGDYNEQRQWMVMMTDGDGAIERSVSMNSAAMV